MVYNLSEQNNKYKKALPKDSLGLHARKGSLHPLSFNNSTFLTLLVSQQSLFSNQKENLPSTSFFCGSKQTETLYFFLAFAPLYLLPTLLSFETPESQLSLLSNLPKANPSALVLNGLYSQSLCVHSSYMHQQVDNR